MRCLIMGRVKQDACLKWYHDLHAYNVHGEARSGFVKIGIVT